MIGFLPCGDSPLFCDFNGIDPVSVAGTLGHASPTTTTKIYSHFFEAAEERNGEIIAKIYSADESCWQKVGKSVFPPFSFFPKSEENR